MIDRVILFKEMQQLASQVDEVTTEVSSLLAEAKAANAEFSSGRTAIEKAKLSPTDKPAERC